MTRWFRGFWQDDSGQDLMEYSLLLCFFGLTTLWLVYGSTASIEHFWTTTSRLLAKGNS